MATEPNTGLTFQEANSLETDALQNELVNYLGVWLNCAVQTVGDTVPPGSPVNGERYIVGASATGAWATHDDELAIYRDGWQFYAPPPAGVPIIKNLDDGADWECSDAGVWSAKAGGGGSDAVDIAYDPTASGLTATDVQAAIDEVAAASGAVSSVNGATGAVVLDDGDVKSVVTALTSGTTVTVDCSLGRNFTLTLGHNVGTLTLSNLAGSGYATEIEIEIKQPGSGGPYTFALPASFKALGGSDTVIATPDNAVTVLSAKTFDNGTTWRYAMQESA